MVTVLVTLVIFLVMITLHEFGHFIMAKAVGVGVLEFAIGMGPAIFKYRTKKTLYSLRAFPIGGYCSLLGEDGDSDSSEAFTNQKLWKRFLVVSAGAILNLILGFVLFCVIVAMMGPFASNEIDSIDERSYLAATEVRTGDKIVEINGRRTNLYSDILLHADELSEGSEFELTVKRGGEKIKVTLLPSVDDVTVTYSENSAQVTDTINGVVNQYTRKLDNVPEEYIGRTFSEKRYIIGFTPLYKDVTAKNILPQAWYYTEYVSRSIFEALGDMISGKTGLEGVSGPVGVAGVVDSAVKSGENSLLNVLFIVAMLTLNLGIFNLLPLPALDGGRLFFMLIEIIRGKPVPPQKEGLVHAVGLMLLLALAVVIFFSDILKLIS